MEKESVFDNACSLIGKVLPGKWMEHEANLNKKNPTLLKFQSISPEAYEKIEKLIGDIKYRVKKSGAMYTQDIRPGRLNFEIDDKFVVTEVYWG